MILPFSLQALLDEAVGDHERLPLRDATLEGRAVAWARVRAKDAPEVVRRRLEAWGARCSLAEGFLFARAGGGRLEIDVADAGDAGPGDRGPADAGAAVFAEAVDRALHAREAGHGVGCWQATNDAIAALLRAAWDGPPAEHGLPPVRARLPKPLRDELSTLRSGLNLRDSLADLRRVLAFARSLAAWLPDGGPLLAEVDALAPRLESARFWNLRDVARWWAPHVREGVLLRGRTPAVYADEGFVTWTAERGVRRLVDLRGPREREEDPYPRGLPEAVACPLDLSDPRGVAGGYARIAAGAGPALRAVLEAVAADEGPVFVHCHAGVDRTGVIVALLGAWLGVPEERLYADYLASGPLVDAARLRLALQEARRLGHLDVDLPPATLARARARLQT